MKKGYFCPIKKATFLGSFLTNEAGHAHLKTKMNGFFHTHGSITARGRWQGDMSPFVPWSQYSDQSLFARKAHCRILEG